MVIAEGLAEETAGVGCEGRADHVREEDQPVQRAERGLPEPRGGEIHRRRHGGDPIQSIHDGE